MKFAVSAAIVAVFLSLSAGPAFAQAAPGVFADANNPSGPPDPNKLDLIWQVDKLTGALSLKIPFPTSPLGGRGPQIPPFSLLYNSSSTVTLQTSTAYYIAGFSGLVGSTKQTFDWSPGWISTGTATAPVGPWTSSGSYFTSGTTTIPDVQTCYGANGTPCTTTYGCTINGPYLYTGRDGSTHDLNLMINVRNSSTDSNSDSHCVSAGSSILSGTTTDGSSILTSQNQLVFPDGTNQNNGSIEDTNGNTASLAKDSAGRTPFTTSWPIGQAGAVPAGKYTVATTAPDGSSETYDITVSKVPIQQYSMPAPVAASDFNCQGQNTTCGSVQPVVGALVSFITSITLPDQSSTYTFTPDPMYGTTAVRL